MSYTRDIPISGDSLGSTRDRVRTNFQEIFDRFAINHFGYNSANAGKHLVVTTPDLTPLADPTIYSTAVNEPKFYGLLASANAGVLQYSRAGSDAVPSPVTSRQAPSGGVAVANNTPTTVLDFDGLTRAMCMVYAFDSLNSTRYAHAFVWFDGTTLRVNQINSATGSILVRATGKLLELFNNNTTSAMNIYWTLDYLRTS